MLFRRKELFDIRRTLSTAVYVQQMLRAFTKRNETNIIQTYFRLFHSFFLHFLSRVLHLLCNLSHGVSKYLLVAREKTERYSTTTPLFEKNEKVCCVLVNDGLCWQRTTKFDV